MSLRSLRARLGVSVALGALALTAAAAIAISFERWQEENQTLPAAIELATFQLAESSDPSAEPAPDLSGVDEFTLVLDQEAQLVAAGSELATELYEPLLDDIWSLTTDDETVAIAQYEDDGRTISAVGVGCPEPAVCDTVIVGAREQGFGRYAADRWAWLVLPPLLVAALAWAAARWLVGRSLRPVEAMRAELDAITSTDLDRRVPVPATGDELQLLGETMNATIGRLGSTVAANERFVADAAHELRSPITGVRAALELESGRTGSELLGDAVGELDRASRLVDDLLVLARRQGGVTEPQREVDVDDVVRGVVAIARSRYPERRVDADLAPVRLIASVDGLTRIATNLIDNACRYGANRVAVSVSTVRTAAGSTCRIVVDDDGAGVTAAERERIFERFARTDESRARSSGGSGLGLAIVAELVAHHQGSVGVTDGPLGGARFTVDLPG